MTFKEMIYFIIVVLVFRVIWLLCSDHDISDIRIPNTYEYKRGQIDYMNGKIKYELEIVHDTIYIYVKEK